MNSTNTFSKRYNLSEEIVKKLPSLFDLNQVEIIPFGVETIANGNQALNEHIKKDISNLSHSSMLVKFAPDFILLKKIGKAIIDDTVTDEEILAAIKEIYFDEEEEMRE